MILETLEELQAKILHFRQLLRDNVDCTAGGTVVMSDGKTYWETEIVQFYDEYFGITEARGGEIGKE